MDKHIALADSLRKPITLEEFGMPRDSHKYELSDPTTSRDTYYSYIFERVLESVRTNGTLAGCNSGHGVVMPVRVRTMYTGRWGRLYGRSSPGRAGA